jgi:hypothetical protein
MSQTITLPQREPLKGIGGVLILFAIGSVVGPLRLVANILNELTGPGMAQAFQTNPVMMDGLLALDVALLVLVLVASWAFWAKKASYPVFYLAFIAALVASPWLAIGWVSLLGTLPVDKVMNLYAEDVTQSIVALIGGGLWFWYLKASERVRNTFVN